jgi:hypothetical protein
MEVIEELKTSGIYALFFNTIDNKYYVGRSIHIWDRYVDHIHLLKTGGHHNYKLVKAYKDSRENPQIHLLEEILPNDTEYISQREIYWIKILEAYTKGFNLTEGGEGAGFGENSPSAKYDNDTYETIFKLLAIGDWTYKEISEELEVELSIVNSIAIGTSHRYLQIKFPGEWESIQYRHLKRWHIHPENVYVDIFKELVNTNVKFNVLAQKYGVKDGVIEDIAAGNTHKYLCDLFPEEYAILLSKKGNRRVGPQSGLEYPKVISPEGVVYDSIKNAAQFSREHGLHQGHFGDLLRGKAKSHKGWRIYKE